MREEKVILFYVNFKLGFTKYATLYSTALVKNEFEKFHTYNKICLTEERFILKSFKCKEEQNHRTNEG